MDTEAAIKLLKRLLRNQPVAPERIVTDGLESYPAALDQLGLRHLHSPVCRRVSIPSLALYSTPAYLRSVAVALAMVLSAALMGICVGAHLATVGPVGPTPERRHWGPRSAGSPRRRGRTRPDRRRSGCRSDRRGTGSAYAGCRDDRTENDPDVRRRVARSARPVDSAVVGNSCPTMGQV